MRKSSREARKPQLYSPSSRQKGHNITEDDENSLTEEEQDVSSAEEDERIDFDALAAKTKKPNKKNVGDNKEKQKAKVIKATASSGAKKVEMNEASEGSNLFEKILTGNRFDADAAEWIEYYKVDRVASINELVNLTLMAAGAKEECVAMDVDLDALDPEEIDQLLSDPIKKMTQEIGSKLYPLVQKGKGKLGNFRNKYKQFWATLTHKIQSSKMEKSVSGSKAVKVEDMLRRTIEQLTMLSSMAIVNIRDAVSEAVMCIADSLSDICNQLKQQVQIAERQLNTETTKKGKETNPKVKAFTLQRDECSKEMSIYASFLNSIFQSIFIHRSKDFNDDIRLNCLQHLPSFIGFDPVRPIKTEYLKYLGWACNDYSNHVRATAIRVMDSLIQNDEYVPHLQNFVDHFMDRFIEMAAGDVDADVSVGMISTLRNMQRQGFLDTISEDKLDMVDMLVFDPAASAKVRKESLLFLMDHTEGFEDFDEKAALLKVTPKTSASAGKTKKAPGDMIALEKKKNTALQLETLTEFAEHHLQQNIEWCKLLAEACLETHKADLLFDWSTIIALLMRESEDLITTALQPNQISILLRLFVVSASFVNQKSEKGPDSTELSTSNPKGAKAYQSQIIRDRRESLNTLLQTKLPHLLQRFKDEESNLAILSELFSCCDVVSSTKSLKSLLATLTELFVSYKNEKLIRNTLNTLKEWLQDSSAAASTRSALESLLREFNTALGNASKDLRKLQNLTGKQKANTSSKASKRKSEVPESQQQLDKLLVNLSPVLIKLKFMFEVMDCRHLLHVNEDDFTDDILEVSELVPSLFIQATSESSVASCISIFVNGLGIIKALLLWRYRDLIDYLSSPSIGEGDPRAIELVNNIVSLRNKLVDTATSFLRSDEDKVIDNTIDPVQRQLQLQGFRTISWIRTVFPLKENDYQIADQLAYSPTQDVLNFLRRVFEKEGKRIQSQMSSFRDDGERKEADGAVQENSVSQLVNELVQKLLFPLSRSLICDLQHLNRRQAAAVLIYWLDPHEKVQEAVRHVAKRLKEGDIVKYLEVQLVVLKGVFQEHVVATLTERNRAIEEEEEDFDFQQSETLEKEGYEKLLTIARKMSSLMGIAKLKGEALIGLTNFFRAGLEFAFSNIGVLGFVEALDPYIRFLPPNETREVFDLLSDLMESNDEVLQQESGTLSTEFQRLVDFKNHLEGKERNIRRLSTSTIAPTRVSHPTKRKAEDRSRISLHNGDDIAAKVGSTSKGKQNKVLAKASNKKTSKGNSSSNKRERTSTMNDVPGRRSSRSAAAKPISYRENDFSDIEDFDEIESFPKDKKRRGDDIPSFDRAPFSFGLDIEDDDDNVDEYDEEEVRDRLSALANDSFLNQKPRGSSFSSAARTAGHSKRARLNDSPPFAVDSSPIGSDVQEMDKIPSRKSRGR